MKHLKIFKHTWGYFVVLAAIWFYQFPWLLNDPYWADGDNRLPYSAVQFIACFVASTPWIAGILLARVLPSPKDDITHGGLVKYHKAEKEFLPVSPFAQKLKASLDDIIRKEFKANIEARGRFQNISKNVCIAAAIMTPIALVISYVGYDFRF